MHKLTCHNPAHIQDGKAIPVTRLLTYNILTGGTGRIDQLSTVIGATGADVVGLVEATNPHVVEELAKRLGMDYRLSGHATHEKDWHVGVMSRLPIVDMQVHTRPGVFTRKYLLEVDIEEADGKLLTVFVIHLRANFYKRAESNRIRRVEMQELLQILARRKGTPHLLMGDFNAIVPGERLKGSAFLSYALSPEHGYLRTYQDFIEHSKRKYVMRMSLRILEALPRSSFLSAITDRASPLYAPRAGIELLHKAGYIDCYRHVNPLKPGFTCPASAPAGRIDFIFASQELAPRLSAAHVAVQAGGVCGEEASDHLPVCATFN
jgi:endonuclease/exonuclease/phosphatase family metal-dependent hydrolase